MLAKPQRPYTRKACGPLNETRLWSYECGSSEKKAFDLTWSGGSGGRTYRIWIRSHSPLSRRLMTSWWLSDDDLTVTGCILLSVCVSVSTTVTTTTDGRDRHGRALIDVPYSRDVVAPRRPHRVRTHSRGTRPLSGANIIATIVLLLLSYLSERIF